MSQTASIVISTGMAIAVFFAGLDMPLAQVAFYSIGAFAAVMVLLNQSNQLWARYSSNATIEKLREWADDGGAAIRTKGENSFEMTLPAPSRSEEKVITVSIENNRAFVRAAISIPEGRLTPQTPTWGIFCIEMLRRGVAYFIDSTNSRLLIQRSTNIGSANKSWFDDSVQNLLSDINLASFIVYVLPSRPGNAPNESV